MFKYATAVAALVGSVPTTQLSSPTIARPMIIVDTDSTAVATQLQNLFPTVWKDIIIWWEIEQS